MKKYFLLLSLLAGPVFAEEPKKINAVEGYIEVDGRDILVWEFTPQTEISKTCIIVQKVGPIVIQCFDKDTK